MSDEEEISDETLMAYSDGELSPDEEQRIEKKLIDDEELRERLAKLSDSPRNVALESLSPEFLADGFLDLPADRRKQPPDESQDISRDIETIDDEVISDETLMAYSDGELSRNEQHRIKEKLIDDEELRERLAEFVDTRIFLEREYLKIKSEGIPGRFLNVIQSSTTPRTSKLRDFFNSLFTMKLATSAAFSLVLGITLGIALKPTVYQAPPGSSEYRGAPKIKEEKIWVNVEGVRQQVVVKESFTVGSYVDCQVLKMESDSADNYMIRCDDARNNTVKTMPIR